MDRSNPARHPLANRFRPAPPENLIGTPISRNRPNPTPFNHLIFSTRYKKPPSPPVTILQNFIRIFFSGESTDPIRVGVPKRLTARDLLLGFPGPTRAGLQKPGAVLHRLVQGTARDLLSFLSPPLAYPSYPLEPPTSDADLPSLPPCLLASLPLISSTAAGIAARIRSIKIHGGARTQEERLTSAASREYVCPASR